MDVSTFTFGSIGTALANQAATKPWKIDADTGKIIYTYDWVILEVGEHKVICTTDYQVYSDLGPGTPVKVELVCSRFREAEMLRVWVDGNLHVEKAINVIMDNALSMVGFLLYVESILAPFRPVGYHGVF